MSLSASTDRTDASTPERIMEPAIWGGRLFKGSWYTASSKIEVLEPATGETLGWVGESQPEDLPDLVRHAAAAQEKWMHPEPQFIDQPVLNQGMGQTPEAVLDDVLT